MFASKRLTHAVLTGMALWLFSSAHASAAVLDFEGLADFAPVTNQYAGLGVTFQNATAGVIPPDGTLNEIDFPPTSGTTLITNEIDLDNDGFPDVTGPMTITFTPYPYLNVGGYFTYADFGQSGDPLTLSAFGPGDPLNPLATLTLFENLGSPQLLSFSGIGPISSLLASGGQGSNFTLDNFTFTGRFAPGGSLVPEPSSLIFLTLGLAALGMGSRLKSNR